MGSYGRAGRANFFAEQHGVDRDVPGGNPAGLPVQHREQGGRVRFQGDREHPGDPVVVHARDQGHQGRSVEYSVPGGNPAGLPVQHREQGGAFNTFMQYATGVSGVQSEQYATGVSGRTWNPLGVSMPRGGSGPTEKTQPKESGEAQPKASSPMEALVQGMAQLQQAMAVQVGLSSSKPEQIRPGTELPRLLEADENAAINVGDWLHGLAAPMGDLTNDSSLWWTEVMKSLDDYYREYINAPTVKKMQLRAEDFSRPLLRESKWLRVDRRAASMLLQAVPDAIRAELLANRLGSTVSILGRIVTIYRPGSSIERQQVLKALECPKVAATPLELVEVLRHWSRWLKRAGDLGLQTPDASILLKGLDVAAKPLLDKHTEVAFKTNMLRFSLDLDAAPTQTTVVRFHAHLLSEFEQLAYRGRGKATSTSIPAVRSVVTSDATGSQTPKGGTSPTTTQGAKPCKFYASEAGCQRQGCKFLHDWSSFSREDRGDRCKLCGGRGHMKKSCPMKPGNGGGKGEDGKGKPNPKMKAVQAGRGEGKRDDGTVQGAEGATSSTPQSAPQASSSSTTGTTAQSSSTSTLDPSATTQDMGEFIRNATQVLKMMTSKQEGGAEGAAPSMKMLKKAVMEYEEKMALLDSGATHPLRKAADGEWSQSDEVDVVLAGDGVKRMRQTQSGTLLNDPSSRTSQTIIPMGSLVSVLGYEVSWTNRRCVLRAPDGKETVLRISAGCPELNEPMALELIARIESEKLEALQRNLVETQQATLRAQAVERTPLWERSLADYVKDGSFEDGFRAISSSPWGKDIPREDLVKFMADIPGSEGEAWDMMKGLGYNRKMRKRLLHKDWLVRLYGGKASPQDKVLKPMETQNTVIVEVDVLRDAQWDLLKERGGIFRLLLWGAATGRVAGLMAQLPNTSSYEHLLRLVTLIEVAKEGRKHSCECMDVPDDGVAVGLWASSEADDDPSAKAFAREWFKKWIVSHWLQVLHFEQGGLGHPLRRPTVMITNLDVTELRGVRDERREEADWGTRSTWAPMLMRTLVQGWRRWKARPGWYPRVVKALKAADRRAWERHLANDHVPHRQDCLQCVHNSTGRPHRRCLHKDCYVLSADTLGPVRVPGPKGERFAVVFTYQYPKQKLCPEDQEINDDELGGWDLDVVGSKVEEEPHQFEHLDFDPEEYSPDEEPGVELTEEQKKEIRELPLLQPQERDFSETAANPSVLSRASEDWWEFREAEGVVIRHHIQQRTTLFRPTSTNGCPIPAYKLEPTRITDIKYVGGGVELETSDWHGPKSGARVLDKRWTGTWRFRVSTAEVAEEEEELKKDEQTWEKLIGDLSKPVEMETIYMVYPVRARRGGDVMLAIQEAVLRLKLLGFPVARLHSDRGSEFASKGLRKWLLERDIFHTRSEALVPQTNGCAERAVRWFKTRAKTLLDGAKVPLKYWTLAMQHAANRRIHERLGIQRPKLLQFGERVMIRRKVFGNNKKYDLTDRWEEAVYLGLSDTIKGGAVVLRPSGVLTETLNLRANVVDPHVLLREAEAEEPSAEVREHAVIDLPEPDHRLKGKQPPPALRGLIAPGGDVEGWVMVTDREVQEQEAKHYYEQGMFDLGTCAKVLTKVEISGRMRNKVRGENVSSLLLGAYVHGGLRGTSKESRSRPWLTKYLNMVLKTKSVEDLGEIGSWTSVGVFKAKDIPPHRDLRNQPSSKNYVVELREAGGGGLWLEKGKDTSGFRGGSTCVSMDRNLPDGKTLNGEMVGIQNHMVEFDARNNHAYVHEEGGHWLIAGFTPLGVEKLPPDSKAYLAMCDFPLEGTGAEWTEEEEVELDLHDDGVQSEVEEEIQDNEAEENARRLRVLILQEGEAEGGSCTRDPAVKQLEEYLEWTQQRLESSTARAMKISPTEAKDFEVEKLLESLQGPLEVVHNVSLPEVKRYITRWKDAIMKEVEALVSSGTVKRLHPEQVRELKKSGLTVLPGEAVFTAKPPSEGGGAAAYYRRKRRMVVCGNYLADQPLNVFASGTSADSLRIAVALAVRNRWTVGCTDISNAFTLAPMPKDKLYGLTPPTVVILAGGAQGGEVWLIERVLYGLREAPRLWGLFRNERFYEAKINYGDKVIILECLETEENMWKILYQGEEELQGVMLVYVDDILLISSNGIIGAIYEWLVSEWKCSRLEWLEEGFIRFLGVELRGFKDGIHVSQAGYVPDLLRQHGVEESNAAVTVPCTREWLQDESDDEDEAPDEYRVKAAQKATGEALWLSTRSRPELAHSVACMAARASKNPHKAIQIGKKILQYLARTPDHGLWYEYDSSEPMVVAYSDASYAPGGGRSFGCILVQLGGMVVSWRASKQPVITLSVAEAELYEGVSAVQMGMGVKAMLSELSHDPVLYLCIDNMAAKGLASESPGSWKTRHLRIRARFLRQEVAANRLVIEHCPGQRQKADIGTKAFDAPKFRELLDLWKIVAWTSLEPTTRAIRTLHGGGPQRALLFILVCMVMMKGALGREDSEENHGVQLDGSLEFYAMLFVFAVAGLGTWEAFKSLVCWAKVRYNRWQRRQRRDARLQERTKTAVEREMQRQGFSSSPTRTTTGIRRARSPMAGDEPRGSRDVPEGLSYRGRDRELRGRGAEVQMNTHTRSTSTQTEVPYQGPNWIDSRRLQGFDGPFFTTPNGDCVHTVDGCHGQRNRTGPMKTYRLCRYCDRDRPLMVVNAPLG